MNLEASTPRLLYIGDQGQATLLLTASVRVSQADQVTCNLWPGVKLKYTIYAMWAYNFIFQRNKRGEYHLTIMKDDLRVSPTFIHFSSLFNIGIFAHGYEYEILKQAQLFLDLCWVVSSSVCISVESLRAKLAKRIETLLSTLKMLP